MRIVVYSWNFYPSIGGTEVTTRTLARVLLEAGHSVRVITASVLGAAPELGEGFEIVRSSSKARVLVHVLRHADLVISKGGVSVTAGLAAILARKPLIVVHESFGTYRVARKRPEKVLDEWLRYRICQYARFHVGVTRACLNSKELPSDTNCTVIYNAVDGRLAARAHETTSGLQQKVTVLYVGRVLESKGVFVLASALQRFEREGEPLTVAVVGTGEDEGRLRAQVSEWRHVQVRFVGPLSNEDLAGLYRHARLLVFPSSSAEGMGLVIAEALTFGKPVVASDQPTIKEVVGDAGLTFHLGDSADLYLQIRRLLDDPELYTHLSSRAGQRAQEFSEGRYLASWQRLLSNLERSERS